MHKRRGITTVIVVVVAALGCGSPSSSSTDGADAAAPFPVGASCDPTSEALAGGRYAIALAYQSGSGAAACGEWLIGVQLSHGTVTFTGGPSLRVGEAGAVASPQPPCEVTIAAPGVGCYFADFGCTLGDGQLDFRVDVDTQDRVTGDAYFFVGDGAGGGDATQCAWTLTGTFFPPA